MMSLAQTTWSRVWTTAAHCLARTLTTLWRCELRWTRTSRHARWTIVAARARFEAERSREQRKASAPKVKSLEVTYGDGVDVTMFAVVGWLVEKNRTEQPAGGNKEHTKFGTTAQGLETRR